MATQLNLCIIYPIHITFCSRYILKRIQTCLSNTTQGLPQAEHLIALSGNAHYIKQAKTLIKALNQANINVVDYTPTSKPYSPGIARNFAVQHSKKANLLFWDIDLLGSPRLFEAIPKHIQSIKKQTNRFEMYPCLYLCQKYTRGLQCQSQQDFSKIWLDVENLKTNSIEHLALATSTILCDKQHFLNIGAFDDTFIGHMGEDLELLNRLVIAYEKHEIDEEYLLDSPSKNPSLLKGFRKHFAQHSTPHLRGEKFSLHLHHSTRLFSRYKNNNNIHLLHEKMAEDLAAITNKKHTKSEYSLGKELYLNKAPTLNKNILERIKKKSLKLLRDPTQFFRDM